MADRARARRMVGIALLASAMLLFVLAALFGTGVIAVGDDLRVPLALTLSVAAVVDAVVGLRFLSLASQ